jgi:hypothetical protein
MIDQYDIDPLDHLPQEVKDTLFQGFVKEWFMTESERLVLIGLLQSINPEVAIEVGTAGGGSLSAISRYSGLVYTIDINSACSQFENRFNNVKFICGSSQDKLPQLIDELQETRAALEFVLIDGDHSREGVLRDIESLLRFKPDKPLYIVMHDSFNPECRKGMLHANWQSNPYVHAVELDFVTGKLDEHGRMWCGLGLAFLLPEKRQGELKVHAKQDMLFRAALSNSGYGPGTSAIRKLRALLGPIRRTVAR